MPTSPMSIVNGQFVFDHTITTAGEYTAVLSTENKFVDKNIGIKITTPNASSPTLNLTDITSIITMGNPSNGVYSPSTSISGNINIGTAGWINTGNHNVSDSNVKIGKVNQSILKIGNTTISSGDTVAQDATEQVIDITEGYSPARTIVIPANSDVTQATVTVSATAQATKPTLTNAKTSNARDVTGSAVTIESSPNSGYFITLQANAPATNITSLTANVNPGYLASASGVSIDSTNGITTSANNQTYYFPITTGVAAGDSASIAKDISASGNNATNVTNTILSGTPSADKPTTSNSYYIAFDITGNSKVTTAGWFPTGSLNPANGKQYFTLTKAAITASSNNATATTNVDPGDVTIAANTTSVSGKTRLEYSPQTGTSGISKYYIAILATAAANTTGAISSISGTTTASVSTAGYAYSGLTGSGSVSGTATAKTNLKNSSVYYIALPTATFANSATSNVTYSDISSSAPELISGDYLYINKGFTDNVKIELAKLIPDSTAVSNLAAEYILHGYSAYNNAGALITGTMQDVTPNLRVIRSTDTYFDSSNTGVSFTVTPGYKNDSAGYLTAHSSYQNGTAVTYYLRTTSLTAGAGNVALVADNTQTNSIYKNTTNPVVEISDTAPATTTNFVYFKVTGSGSVSNNAAGWLAANSSATGSSQKYIRIVKYDGSFTTGTGS